MKRKFIFSWISFFWEWKGNLYFCVLELKEIKEYSFLVLSIGRLAGVFCWWSEYDSCCWPCNWKVQEVPLPDCLVNIDLQKIKIGQLQGCLNVTTVTSKWLNQSMCPFCWFLGFERVHGEGALDETVFG